ncbi:hypothetical protein [Rhodococcoides fascians]|uniref:hypothetical protein n=1 Tax=Rhodococcoides fascians TaxID=1828 RepID=UPI00055F3AB7|nr:MULTISPECIES: hypothetical protein [Rhodococcus]OZF03657.1 hypothetical protein CH301_09740 [Rhodococcus sp. 15-1189-1-1a]OZF17462.1 hypothetical protein CH299_10290 [Rhodococcus sp. 14-2686-1-2]
MTSTTKSAQFRDVAVSTGGTLVKAAKIFGTGSAGVGLQLATRAYALARREAARRRVRRATSASSKIQTAKTRASKIQTAKTSSGPSLLGTPTRKIVAVGAVLGAAGGVAVLVSKRRNAFDPPADAPPSLGDYSESPVNGSSAQAATRADTPQQT